VVALTHAHQDHLGGLTAILENFRVGQLWIGREVSSPALARLEKLARERKIPIEHERGGKSFRWHGVDGNFLWPDIPPEETGPSAKNNDSLVFRLHYGTQAFLLPGDAEKQVEREILSENATETMRPMCSKSAITAARIRRRPNSSRPFRRALELYPLVRTILTATPAQSSWKDWRMRVCASLERIETAPCMS
jgi:hypothetical protein